MRLTLLILFFVLTIVDSKAQIMQPIFLGNLHWKQASNQHPPELLPVKKTVSPVSKTVTPDQTKKMVQAKINPNAILIHKGPTIPIKQKVSVYGKKINAPILSNAPPLLTRDNADFNISYTDKKHGFPGNNTNDFAEDDQHNIWISSDNGLYKYDGFHYFIYNHKIGFPSMPNLSLLFDKQKRLWLASDSGVYFIQNDSLFSLKSNELDFSKVPSFKVQADHDDRIWVSTKQNGSICIDENTIQIYDKRCGLTTNYILSTLIDKKGNIYIGANNVGLFVIEPDKMRLLFSTSNNMKVHSILSLYEDEDGIWVGGYLSGLMLLGKKDTIQYSISGKFNERIFDIKKAPGGGLWLASYSSELCYFDKKNLLIINEKNGLINRFPYFLFQDSFKNLWVSNLESGFSRVNEISFYLQKYENPTIENIKKIIPDNNNGKWIITYGKNLIYHKNKTATSYIIKEKNGVEPYAYLNDGIINKDGSLWLGNYGGGVVHATKSSYTVYSYSSYPEYAIINSIKRDAQNNVWFSPTDFGLIVLAKDTFWHYTQNSGLLSNTVKELFLNKRNQIFWSYENGFQRLEYSTIQTLYIGNHLLKDQVNSYFDLDANTTLLGTSENGLLLIDKNKVYQLTQKEGLSSNYIKTIIRDAYGTVWVSTNKGVESFKINGTKIFEHRIYNSANGFYILDAENVFLDSSGFPIWSVKDKKLVLNPNFINDQKGPLFRFESFIVDEKINLDSSTIAVLPNQKLEINYTSIFWGRENNLLMKYLLISDRNDTSINVIGDKGHITLSELSPGQYKIVLFAQDNNQSYYSTPLVIRIKNYWYNTWLFRFFGLVALLTIIVSYFRQKSKRQNLINTHLKIKVAEQTAELLKEKEELINSHQIINKQIVEKDVLIQEINHRVKNNLQFILAMVEMQMGADYKKDTVESLMSTSRRITAMSLVHEMLYDNKDTQGLSIKDYVTELVENLKELAIDKNSSVLFKLDIIDIILDSKPAISLGMIISELVSNSLKHAFTNIESPEICIQLIKLPETDLLKLRVVDNGHGIIDENISIKGFGTQLIDIFSRQLEGNYSIDFNKQFSFELTFKQ